jgi:hypothetical protein
VEINLSPTGVFPKPIECGSIHMFKEYESIHCRKGFLIKTNQSKNFYGLFKVAALWVSPIPLSGLFPTSEGGITISFIKIGVL